MEGKQPFVIIGFWTGKKSVNVTGKIAVGNFMNSVFFDIVLYSLILSLAFSFACMKRYLLKRKLVKFQLVYRNPFSFFSMYINSTKEDEGKIGIWFWVFIISFCAILFFGLIELIIQLSGLLL